jgi:hypothetical protein
MEGIQSLFVPKALRMAAHGRSSDLLHLKSAFPLQNFTEAVANGNNLKPVLGDHSYEDSFGLTPNSLVFYNEPNASTKLATESTFTQVSHRK